MHQKTKPRHRRRIYLKNYQRLEQAALEAIFAGKRRFTFRCVSDVEFPEDFPKRKLQTLVDNIAKWEISAYELIEFLYTTKRISYNVKSLQGILQAGSGMNNCFSLFCRLGVGDETVRMLFDKEENK